jgi:hypothetical protein
MSCKLKLDPDTLAVQTFEAGEAPPRRGTVEAHACTAGNTCRCPTSLYQCGDFPETAYSCPPTAAIDC